PTICYVQSMSILHTYVHLFFHSSPAHRNLHSFPTRRSSDLAIYQAIAKDERRPGLYREYAADFFDLVVVDECHRGSARDESNWRDRKSTRLNSSHLGISYAVFCLKKKINKKVKIYLSLEVNI